MASNTQRGRHFEELVARLERLAEHGAAEVVSPYRVPDAVTGQAREIDIAVVDSAGTVHIAIECRNRRRKVDATWIEQLSTKARDTGARRVIAVSKNGFSGPALIKARAYDIETRVIESVTDDDLRSWMPTVDVREIRTSWALVAVQVFPFEAPEADYLANAQPADLVFVTDSGTCSAADLIVVVVKEELRKSNDRLVPGGTVRLPSGRLTPFNQTIIDAYMVDGLVDDEPAIKVFTFENKPGTIRLRTRLGDLDLRLVRIAVLAGATTAPANLETGKYVGQNGALRGFINVSLNAPDLGIEGAGATISVAAPGGQAAEHTES